MVKSVAMAQHPEFPWLSGDDAAGVERVLHSAGALAADERVTRCGKAGEGNMNLTLRVLITGTGGQRSVVVKQSRPWVEKYEAIAAPWDRAISELRFYQRLAGVGGVAGRMPRLLAANEAARVLVLEDLGFARDLTGLYGGDRLTRETCVEIASLLRALHDATRGQASPEMANRAMRELNHQHMYVIPLEPDNGLALSDVEPSLPAAADALRRDREYLRLVRLTGERYLADGDCLLHGDYFPGSWLATERGLRVIDPEFSFFGDAEFDLGVCIAHLSLARRPWSDAQSVLAAYDATSLDSALLSRFAGCEVMRRLIGYAQLPLPPGSWRGDLLAASRRCVLSREITELWQ